MKQNTETTPSLADKILIFFKENTTKIQGSLDAILSKDSDQAKQAISRFFDNFLTNNDHFKIFSQQESDIFFQQVEKSGFLYTLSQTLQPVFDRLINFETGTLSDEFKALINFSPENYKSVLEVVKTVYKVEQDEKAEQLLAYYLQKDFITDFFAELTVNRNFEAHQLKLQVLNVILPIENDKPQKFDFPLWYVPANRFHDDIIQIINLVNPPQATSDKLNEIKLLIEYFAVIYAEFDVTQPESGELVYYQLQKIAHAIENTEGINPDNEPLKSKIKNIIIKMENFNVPEPENSNPPEPENFNPSGLENFNPPGLENSNPPGLENSNPPGLENSNPPGLEQFNRLSRLIQCIKNNPEIVIALTTAIVCVILAVFTFGAAVPAIPWIYLAVSAAVGMAFGTSTAAYRHRLKNIKSNDSNPHEQSELISNDLSSRSSR